MSVVWSAPAFASIRLFCGNVARLWREWRDRRQAERDELWLRDWMRRQERAETDE